MRTAARITLVAGALLVIAAWAIGHLGLAAGHRAAVGVFPEVVGALLVVLAWRFRRHRLALAALILAACDTVLADTADPGRELTLRAMLVVAIADLALLSVLHNRPLWRPQTIAWLGVLALQVWWVVAGIDHPMLAGTSAWLVREPASGTVALISALSLIVAFAVRRTAVEAGLLWAAAAVTLAAILPGVPAGPHLLLTAGQLALLTSLIEDSYRLAYHDQLTGLPGRRALDEAMAGLGEPFVIAMADVDHFKRFNDRHGHDAGDQVLRMVADELARVGGGGRAFRFGGEEFTILFPGARVADVREDIESVRRSIADRRFALRAPDRPRTRPDTPTKSSSPTRRVTVTVSFGAADAGPRRPTADAVLRAADRALYRAKRAGRNRVVAVGDRL